MGRNILYCRRQFFLANFCESKKIKRPKTFFQKQKIIVAFFFWFLCYLSPLSMFLFFEGEKKIASLFNGCADTMAKTRGVYSRGEKVRKHGSTKDSVWEWDRDEKMLPLKKKLLLTATAKNVPVVEEEERKKNIVACLFVVKFAAPETALFTTVQDVPTRLTTFSTHPLISLASAQGVPTRVTTSPTHPWSLYPHHRVSRRKSDSLTTCKRRKQVLFLSSRVQALPHILLQTCGQQM